MRVVIVDGHPIFRLAMRHLLEQTLELEVCGMLGDSPIDFERLVALRPDLVTLDTNRHLGSSIELIKELQRRLPQTRVLVIANHDEQLYALRTIQAGAHGYVSKSANTATISRYIREVLRGRLAVSDTIAESLRTTRHVRRVDAEGVDVLKLSPRELEVFRLMGQGMKTCSIASDLSIRVKTVETHQAKIKRKLGLHGMPELRRVAAVWSAQRSPAMPPALLRDTGS